MKARLVLVVLGAAIAAFLLGAGPAQAGIWPDFLPGHEAAECFVSESGLLQGYPEENSDDQCGQKRP